MRIISFAATSEALLAGAKTRTVRAWKHRYARQQMLSSAHPQLHRIPMKAYDRRPRFGGKQLGIIEVVGFRLVEPDRDARGTLRWPDALYYEAAREAEGLAWMEERGLLCEGKAPRAYYEGILRAADWLYVLDFELVQS